MRTSGLIDKFSPAADRPVADDGAPGSTGLLVFDLDGVIADSQPQMRHVFAECYRRHCGNGTPPFAAFFAHMGRPLEEILRCLDLPVEMAATYRQVSRECLVRIQLFDGILDVLATARGLGYAMAIITGKDRLRTNELLHHFGLHRWFAAVVCGDDPVPSKPDPAGLHAIVNKVFGAHGPAVAKMIGDAEADIRCARAAGFEALGAGWGFSDRDSLCRAGAEHVFDTPGELAGWLRASHNTAAHHVNTYVPADFRPIHSIRGRT